MLKKGEKIIYGQTGVCEVLDITEKKHNQSLKKKLGFSDERFMQTAETLLFGELAAALNIEPQNVPEYIKSKIG